MAKQYERVRLESMQHYGFGVDVMKTIKVCGACGIMADSSQHFCRECGQKLSQETLYEVYKARHKACPQCETIVTDESEYCPQCGAKINEEQLQPDKPNRIKEIIL